MKKIVILLLTIMIGGTASAQSEYFNRKVSLFDKLPVKRGDIVFLGNSITDGCEWAELFDRKNIKNRGISGDRVEWMFGRLDQITDAQPRKLFLMIGVNDLGSGRREPEEVGRDIVRLLEIVAEKSPRTKIYVQSTLPVNPDNKRLNKNYRDLNPKIVKLNAIAGEYCREHAIPFIDLHSLLRDEEGKLRSDKTLDGLHLNGDGYMIWKAAIEKYVR